MWKNVEWIKENREKPRKTNENSNRKTFLFQIFAKKKEKRKEEEL